MTDRELMQQALEALTTYDGTNGEGKRKRVLAALRERLAQLEQETVWIQPNHLQKARQAPFLCRVEPRQRDDFVPFYTTPPHRKPLIHEEAPAFRKWFDAWWVGDGEQGEKVPPQGDAFDEYLANYTLAFGAWMAAKEAAHGIKGKS